MGAVEAVYDGHVVVNFREVVVPCQVQVDVDAVHGFLLKGGVHFTPGDGGGVQAEALQGGDMCFGRGGTDLQALGIGQIGHGFFVVPEVTETDFDITKANNTASLQGLGGIHADGAVGDFIG